jgi:hypothetical protein
MVSPAKFDHENLDVYQLELKFLTWVSQFLADLLLRNEFNPAKKCWYVLWPKLTKPVERFDPYQHRVRENAPGVAGPFEYEEDDEHEDE